VVVTLQSRVALKEFSVGHFLTHTDYSIPTVEVGLMKYKYG
jgi:ABC-type tungstate transport system substrate-binding protein